MVPVNDSLVEGPQTVDVVLVDGPDYDLGASTSATITIADQPVPVVSIDVIDGSASEAGDTGTFRFTRTGDTTFGLSITIARSGSATNASDYSNISTTLSFLPGQATFDRVLVPMNDASVEGDETATLTVVDGRELRRWHAGGRDDHDSRPADSDHHRRGRRPVGVGNGAGTPARSGSRGWATYR